MQIVSLFHSSRVVQPTCTSYDTLRQKKHNLSFASLGEEKSNEVKQS